MFFYVLVSLFLCAKGNLDKEEGTACEWEGLEGRCVKARQCLSFAVERLKGNLTLFPGKFPSICSFHGQEPVVCCVACDNLGYNAKDLNNKTFLKTGRKYEEQCLLYQYILPYKCDFYYQLQYVNDNRRYDDTLSLNIYGEIDKERKCVQYKNYTNTGSRGSGLAGGGVGALRGDFPHMALVGYGEDLQSVEWLCGGSLISDRHILTAAHCGAHPQLGPATYVALGMLKRSDPPEYWKIYKVKVFYPHEEYKPPHKYHDIAIIETEKTVNLTDGVRPACLTHKLQFPGDEVAYATGWGSLGPRMPNADVMQKVTLQKFSAEKCSAQYPPHRHLLSGYNHTTQMCYGDPDAFRDTCEGDSGGPLQKKDPDAKYCPYAIIGVTSSGHACGTVGEAGLYTRTSYYLPWIESIVWPGK